jgi:hypothetical protein
LPQAKSYLSKNSAEIPEMVTEDIRVAGGLKSYIRPFVETTVANMLLRLESEAG